MFINENFTFNGIYSRDMNVSICSINNGNAFNDIGVEYVTGMTVENNLIDYHPYFSETFAEPSDIELNLLVYDDKTMEAIDVSTIDMMSLYDWLITDDFAPFISDDDLNIIYYFKVIRINKVLTYDNKGYLRVIFKPFSKYSYKREIYDKSVNGETTLEIFNPSKQLYNPIMEIINLGDASSVNKINNMEVFNLEKSEQITIDNLSKIIQDKNKSNKFNCCNRNWIELKPKETTTLTLNGNFRIKIICEFPIIK